MLYPRTVREKEILMSSADALVEKALSLRAVGRIEDALACIDEALELAPNDPQAYAQRTVLLRLLGRHEEALAISTRLIQEYPESQDLWLIHGNNLAELDRIDDALQAYDKVIQLDSHYVGGWVSKARMLNHLSRSKEALRCAKRATLLDDSLDSAWWFKGVAERGLGRFREAIDSLNVALKLNPQHIDALLEKGRSHEDMEQYNEAVACYDSVLDIAPEASNVLENTAICLLRLGRYDAALGYAERAIDANGLSVVGRIAKTESLEGLGKQAEAMRVLTGALEIAEGNEELHVHLDHLRKMIQARKAKTGRSLEPGHGVKEEAVKADQRGIAEPRTETREKTKGAEGGKRSWWRFWR
jgi:tetratricopeptide (TPR) repeat protein